MPIGQCPTEADPHASLLVLSKLLKVITTDDTLMAVATAGIAVQCFFTLAQDLGISKIDQPFKNFMCPPVKLGPGSMQEVFCL